jgi:hypothetical protein
MTIVFCSNCDYAMCKELIDAARFDYGCPRCTNSFSEFYTLDSKPHKTRRQAFERGELMGASLPLLAPNNS